MAEENGIKEAGANQNNPIFVNINHLRHIFINPTSVLPIFHGDLNKDIVKARFLFVRVKIVQTAACHWSDKATVGNFKLALKIKRVDWLSYIRDTKGEDTIKWSSHTSSNNTALKSRQ
jgi:hypothetical protein